LVIELRSAISPEKGRSRECRFHAMKY